MANGTWKIARRGNTQLPLVIVVVLAVVLVLLGKAQGALFDRARMRVTDWMQPMLESVHAPVQAFNRWMGSADEILHVYQENLALKDENARLRQWRNVAVVMQGRVQHYQDLLHAVPDPDVNSVLARVIGRATRPFLETMILDAGTSENVKPGEAVVDARGMIGRIYLAGARTSWVILLTDLNSRIPVTIASSTVSNQPNIQAIMSGDNTALPGLDTLASTVVLQAGDQVVSSGDGGLLPPGLPIGTVVATTEGYRVALLADAATAQDVEVLAFRKPPEVLPPASDTQLPAVAAGLKPVAPPPPAPPVQIPAANTAPGAVAKPPAVAPITGTAQVQNRGQTPPAGSPSRPQAAVNN